MKKLFTALCLSVLALSASATVHTVNVSNNVYSPKQLTITLGDTVRFQWVAGNHPTKAVDDLFPGFEMSQLNPTHDLILDSLGTYAYYCEPHQAQGMTGTIVVTAVSSAAAAVKKSEVSVYPNPASSRVTVSHNFQNIDGVRITNMIGQQVRFVRPMAGTAGKVEIDIADLPKGIYLVNLQSRGATVFTQRLVKDR